MKKPLQKWDKHNPDPPQHQLPPTYQHRYGAMHSIDIGVRGGGKLASSKM